MRISLIIAAGALALLGCSQTPTEAATETESADAAPAPLAGGFGAADAENAETKAAEALAIEAIYKAHPTRMLPFVVSRDVQVVAGLNYKFRIAMGGSKDDLKKLYEVTVYRDLDGKMEVTALDEIEVD